MDFYTDFGGYPTSYFDGTVWREGAKIYTIYRNDYLNRRSIPTDVTIDAVGIEVSGQTYRARITVCIEPDGVAKTMKMYTVQVLDYWPPSPTYHRNGFKQAAYAVNLTLSPGYCRTFERTFTFDDASWSSQENIKIIMWAQEPQSSSPPTDRAEVFQAAIMPWPFPEPGVAGDFNGDTLVDLDDYGEFAGCFTGSGGGSVVADCVPGDLDFDGDIDCEDWGIFALAWTDVEDLPELSECTPHDLLPALAPHDARKNRYISFNPNNAETRVAMEVEMTEGPGATGVVGWVGAPYDPSCQNEDGSSNGEPCEGNDYLARVMDTPQYRSWPEALIHVADCEIVPVATYEIRATSNEVAYGAPLEIATILKPGARHYGDVVGQGTGDLLPLPGYTPPNGVVNVSDVSGYLLTAQGPSTPSTHPTWVDLHGQGDGSPPDLILNVSDLQRIKFGFMGLTYTETPEQLDPADCP